MTSASLKPTPICTAWFLSKIPYLALWRQSYMFLVFCAKVCGSKVLNEVEVLLSFSLKGCDGCERGKSAISKHPKFAQPGLSRSLGWSSPAKGRKLRLFVPVWLVLTPV